jgi:hypothetical protein
MMRDTKEQQSFWLYAMLFGSKKERLISMESSTK